METRRLSEGHIISTSLVESARDLPLVPRDHPGPVEVLPLECGKAVPVAPEAPTVFAPAPGPESSAMTGFGTGGR